jgi:hypothetical protein
MALLAVDAPVRRLSVDLVVRPSRMSAVDTFCAVHSSGLLIPNRSSITALSLLFDKVYLPANIEAIRAFSQSYRIIADSDELPEIRIEPVGGGEHDPFASLTAEQRATAFRCLDWSFRFIFSYASLFGDVFQTNAFEGNSPFKVELVRQGGPGELNTYNVSQGPMRMTDDDEEYYPRLISEGYVPIVTYSVRSPATRTKLNEHTTKQLAALLAMKSVEMLFPRTRAARAGVILEARQKLGDHLPQFWSSMFKLTSDMRKLIKEEPDPTALLLEAENLVDATVRPALLDLRHKIEAERKQWFYRIFSPIQKGLRLMIGNPPLTQQQLITNALVLASDAASAGADHLRTIEALKQDSGITYLLELDKLSESKT